MIPSSIDDILAITEGHPLIRSVHPTRRGTAWRGGGAVAFLNLDRDRTTIKRVVGLGAPEAVAHLLTSLRGELPQNVHVNVPRGTPLSLADPSNWNLRVAYEAPPAQPAEDLVDWSVDSDAITELLKRTGPDWSVWPHDGKARRWAGIRRDDGLMACLADTTSSTEVGQVAAVAVHPEARRRALGASITAWAMRKLFADGCDGVALGVYPENVAAMRMYDRLGFTGNEPRTSGRLPA